MAIVGELLMEVSYIFAEETLTAIEKKLKLIISEEY
jgi:hypothetical protein